MRVQANLIFALTAFELCQSGDLDTDSGSSFLQLLHSGLAANKFNKKGFDELQADSILALLFSSVNAAYGPSAFTSDRKRRHLLQVPSDANGMTKVAYSTIVSAANDIAALLSQQAVVGGPERLASDPKSNICVAVARVLGADVASYTLDARCNRSNVAKVTFPSSYSSFCSNDSVCSTASSILLSAYYYYDAARVAAVIEQFADVLGHGVATNIEIISGVMDVNLPSNRSNYVCNNVTSCPLTVTIPITNLNASKTRACIRANQLDALSLRATTDMVTMLDSPSQSYALCSGTKAGAYLVLQYDPTATIAQAATNSSLVFSNGKVCPQILSFNNQPQLLKIFNVEQL